MTTYPVPAALRERTAQLSQTLEHHVVVESSEFCAPGLNEGLDQAGAKGTREVIGVTPMMTSGGEHFEVDIPAATRRARERYPEIPLSYAWPVDVDGLAQFLAAQTERPI